MCAPEELIFVFHELRFNEIGRTCSDAESVQVFDERRKEGMVCVQFNLA